MKCIKRSPGQVLLRTVLLAGVLGVAAGCSSGGGSGDSDFDDQDLDGDGILNGEDDDDDNDGIPDVDDLFTDRDQDGFDDTSFLSALDVEDYDNDGTINVDDFDADGDGIDDLDDPFVDLDDDGLDDRTGEEEPQAPTNVGSDSELSCGGAGGSDTISATEAWNDNCTITQNVDHANSYYTVGVQRILWCLGFDDGNTTLGDPVTSGSFADARFGPSTARAVEAYQTDRGLSVDGLVGPQTWGQLEQELGILSVGFDVNYDTYTVAGARTESNCDQVQFYKVFDEQNAFQRWRIADNPGSETQVEFSVRSPFD